MLDLFSRFTTLFQPRRCLIDNTTFHLNYQYTFGMLCIASLLVTSHQYFGDPIDCIAPDSVPQKVFETYCWILGTFTLPYNLVGKNSQNIVYQGVGTYSGLVDVTENGDEIYHAWYQWVSFVLFFQAVLFYFPHWLWKYWEGGKLSLIIHNLGENSLNIGPENTISSKKPEDPQHLCFQIHFL